MKRWWAALLAALMLMLCAPCAAAQVEIAVYAAADSLTKEKAQQLVQLLQRAIPEAAFSLSCEEETGESLRALVMQDRAPQIALCTAQEAVQWVDEGLLLALDTSLGDVRRVEPAVLAACMREESAFLAPLLARHRQVAVNRETISRMGFSFLLDQEAYPVWLPMQLELVLEEAALSGEPAMELWPLTPQESEGILAMAQALYVGPILSADGVLCMAKDSKAAAGVEWLGGMVGSGLIGMAGSREEALQNFLAGKTAFFIDWTQADAQAAGGRATEERFMVMPYPSSAEIPVRAFEVLGAAVFASGDQRTDAIARAAIAVLMEDAQAQRLLGERAIFADGALWLPCIGTSRHAAALRGMLCTAVGHVLAGEMSPEAAVQAVSAAARGDSARK